MSYKLSDSKPEERFDIGYVIWGDANSSSGTAQHVPSHEAIPLLSAGVIVKDDAEGVTVAMDFSAEGAFREIRFIPRVNVTRVCVLKKDAVSRSPQWAKFPEPLQLTKPLKGRKKGKK